MKHTHEWIVIATLHGFVIEVECAGCGALGTVDDPSPLEWSNASMRRPFRVYQWLDGSRVTICEEGGQMPHYVDSPYASRN
jgi:hypothetical protein